MAPEAVPTTPCADYLLEPVEAPKDEEKKPDNNEANAVTKKCGTGSLVIFAVDISGSMSTTTEVPALQAEWTAATGRGGGGTRYISRLEAIKEAVSRQIERMALTDPLNKVSSFSLLLMFVLTSYIYVMLCVKNSKRILLLL